MFTVIVFWWCLVCVDYRVVFMFGSFCLVVVVGVGCVVLLLGVRSLVGFVGCSVCFFFCFDAFVCGSFGSMIYHC